MSSFTLLLFKAPVASTPTAALPFFMQSSADAEIIEMLRNLGASTSSGMLFPSSGVMTSGPPSAQLDAVGGAPAGPSVVGAQQQQQLLGSGGGAPPGPTGGAQQQQFSQIPSGLGDWSMGGLDPDPQVGS